MAKTRGCSHVAVGTFSHLFPKLDPVVLTEDEAAAIGGPGGVMHDFDSGSPDSAVPAGYIFFAQFMDHDITLDATSVLRPSPDSDQARDVTSFVKTLGNVRSASLDLDCVYGFGPEASPHIYDGEHLAVADNGVDLARSPGGVALIGDPRNDENIFIGQIQLVMHQLHNRIFDERVYQRDISTRGWNRFEAAQEETRYHYQFVVLFDFLKRICDPKIFAFAAERICGDKGDFPLCYGLDDHGKLPMPVEFSTAAYRVGHTMVRDRYALNARHTEVELFDESFGTLGFTALPEDLAPDWRYMLDLDPCVTPHMAKAFDPAFADELMDLPIVGSRNPNDRSLAFRNLMRASALGVASGQEIADEMRSKGYPLTVTDLALDEVHEWKRVEAVLHKSGTDLSKKTPLFYYLLRESEIVSGGARYGPLGSAILMEVFGGMLRLCDDTFVEKFVTGEWRPDACIAKPDADFDKSRLIKDADHYPLDLADLVRFAKRLDRNGRATG
ncbi:peroxidase family protein [Roseovarius tibetensis]|uniref:peroxidase family protein n=1 Tax=Roseovarius tibetensis TaxID=2685897 RepID=UPI003D7FFAA0